MKALHIWLLSFIQILLLSGCIDSPVNIGMNSISGKVVDANGFPCPNFKIYVNYLSTTKTDNFGNFSLNDINFPYELTVYNDDGLLYIFSGIRKTHTEISLLSYFYNRDYQYNLKINFPLLKENKLAFVRFVSNENTSLSNYPISNEGDSVSFQEIYFSSTDPVLGKLIYLETDIENYDILDFEKFAIKDVELFYQIENEFNFTNEEISFDPDEINLGVNVFVPNGMYAYDPEIYLSFYNNKNSDIQLTRWDYEVKSIPLLPLSIDYKIKIQNGAYGLNYEKSLRWIYINPGENAAIIHNIPPRPLLPLNFSVNISDTSFFKIDDNSETGIYEYFFNDINSNSKIYLYTDKKIFRMIDIPSNFRLLENNRAYKWNVRKLTGYNSVDEFLSKPFIMNDKNGSLENSQYYIFTTAP